MTSSGQHKLVKIPVKPSFVSRFYLVFDEKDWPLYCLAHAPSPFTFLMNWPNNFKNLWLTKNFIFPWRVFKTYNLKVKFICAPLWKLRYGCSYNSFSGKRITIVANFKKIVIDLPVAFEHFTCPCCYENLSLKFLYTVDWCTSSLKTLWLLLIIY